MKYLIKLDRFFAWILFAGMLLYFISGYGMTKGIIDASLAAKLHLNILTYVILIAFTVHPLFAIHLALKRWRMWNTGTITLLFAFFSIFFGSFIYVDRFYQPKPINSASSSQNINLTYTNTTTQAKTFTISELAKYDGKNGNPSYVAVDGNIYDLSTVFANGSHFGHFAGKELTNAFYTRHAKSALAKYPIVGTLVK